MLEASDGPFDHCAIETERSFYDENGNSSFRPSDYESAEDLSCRTSKIPNFYQSRNPQAVLSKYRVSESKPVHGSPLRAAHNLTLLGASGSHQEAGTEASDCETIRTEDFLGRFCELSQQFKSLPDVARLVAAESCPATPKLATESNSTGVELSRKIQKMVTIHTPSYSLTPEALTPRSQPFDDELTQVGASRNHLAEMHEVLEDYAEDTDRKFSATAIPPAFLQQNTSYLQNDYYQTVSEMGGGVAASAGNNGTDSWRDFKKSVDLDAYRIRQDLEREFRDKQMRSLLEAHQQTDVTAVVHEVNAQKSRNIQQRAAVGTQSKASMPAFARPLTLSANRRPDSVSPTRNSAGASQRHPPPHAMPLQSNLHRNANGAATIDKQRLRASADGLHLQRESNATTSENATPTLSPRETLEKKLLELTEMNLAVRRLQKEKELFANELRSVRENLNKYQSELRSVERNAQNSKVRAEEVRSELRAIERKRDTTMDEVQTINNELNAKKNELRQMEQRLHKCITEIEALETLGISRQEIETMIEERNRLLDLVRENEQDSNARYELEKQLASTKEQARLLEQRLIVDKIDPLEKELNAKLQLLRDVQSEKDEFGTRISQLEERLVIQETEHTKVLKEKDQEIDSLRRSYEKQLREVHEQLNVERSRLRAEYEERCDDQERRLQIEKEQNLIAMKRDMHETKAHFEAQLQARQHEIDLLQAQHNEELHEAHLRFENEKSMAFKELETRLSRELGLKLNEVESSMMAKVGELNKQLSAKEEEVTQMKQRLVEKEEASRQAIEKLRAEMQHDHEDAFQRERTRMMEEHEIAWRDEVRALKDEMQRAINSLNMQLEQEHELSEAQQRKIVELEGEIASERDKQRLLVREKLDAITRARQTVQEELEHEYNSQMEILIRKHADENEKLRESFRTLEQDLEKLRRSQAQQAEQANTLPKPAAAEATSGALTWKQTLVFLEEINEECRKIAALLGVRARIVDLEEAHQMHELGVETALHHAIANFKASNQLLRKFAEDTRLAEEDARQKLGFSEEEHAQEISQLKQSHDRELNDLHDRVREYEQFTRAQTLDTERSVAVETERADEFVAESSRSISDELRAELSKRDEELREIKSSMGRWKEETASRMAKRLQEEFKADFDRKLNELKSVMKQKWRKREQHLASSSQDDSNVTGTESNFEEDHVRGRAKHVESVTVESSAQAKGASIVNSNAATNLISYLQDRVKELRGENLGLRKRMIDSGLPVPEQIPLTVPISVEVHSNSSLPTNHLRASVDRRVQPRSPVVKQYLKSDMDLHGSVRSTPLPSKQQILNDLKSSNSSSMRRPGSRSSAQRDGRSKFEDY